VPRTIVGFGETVADGTAVAEGVTVGVGVVLVVGDTQATTATDPAIRRAAVLTAAIFAYAAKLSERSPLGP